MGLLIVLAVGGALGWLAGLLTRSAGSGVALNIILGIIGALLGAFFIGTLVGGGNLLDAAIDPMTGLVALAGAAVLLVTVHGLRGRMRRRPEESEEQPLP